MFIKVEETEQPVSKPKPKKKKRQLTEKQLEGLARGRAKMQEKRKMKKAVEERRKQLSKKDTKAEEENQVENQKTRQRKKKVILESKVVEQEAISYKEKKARQNKSLDKFNQLKVSALKHIGSSEELDEFERIMGGISKDMAKEPEQLYSYLREHADRLNKKNLT